MAPSGKFSAIGEQSVLPSIDWDIIAQIGLEWARERQRRLEIAIFSALLFKRTMEPLSLGCMALGTLAEIPSRTIRFFNDSL